jgi:hypothetical protein
LRRLIASSVVAAALAGSLVAVRATAVTASRVVGLYVSVSGSGTLGLAGGPSFTCHVGKRLRPCTHRFEIRRGSRVVVRALPARGWKLTTWAGACHGSSATCSLRLEDRLSLKVTFVPPGDFFNPYPLGQAVKLNSWRLKVDSAILDADAQMLAVIDPNTGKPANSPPPPGTQYTLVRVTLKWLRGRASTEGLGVYVKSHLSAESDRDGDLWLYAPDLDCEAPPADLGLVTSRMAPGQSVTGYVCYEIASTDASTLLLRPTTLVRKNGLGGRNVSFALHR